MVNHGPHRSAWRKSSYSNADYECVEVHGSRAAVRDSKNPGPILTGDVPGLVEAIKTGVLSS